MHTHGFSDKKENTAMKRLLIFLPVALLSWSIIAAPFQRQGAAGEGPKLLQPSKDATLIESPKGDIGSSTSETIFVGRTGQSEGSKRRGLIAFDIAGEIPARSRILSAKLTMTVRISAGGDRPASVKLHRVLMNWGEGSSASKGGTGAQAESGDPTWIYSAYSTRRWSRPGGTFSPVASANLMVKGPGAYTWNSSPRVVADVQAWLNSPTKNFGWIIIGDESHAATAKVFHSRESSDEAARPQLAVTFKPPAR